MPNVVVGCRARLPPFPACLFRRECRVVRPRRGAVGRSLIGHQRMRILSIGAGLGRGGTERAVETFSIEYQRLGHDVAVLAWQEGGVRQTTLEQAGIEVFVG